MSAEEKKKWDEASAKVKPVKVRVKYFQKNDHTN